jgi:hypothetical protein
MALRSTRGGRRAEPSMAECLHKSIHRLRTERPEMSAQTTLTPLQRRWLMGLGLALVVMAVVRPKETLLGLNAGVTLLYLTAFLFGLQLVREALRRPSILSVSDEEARSIPAGQLPVYTVLVPAYHEPEVIAAMIHELENLNYPADRLDVKLLLEADDNETIAAAQNACPAAYIEIVRVPNAAPRTKPKACNYGLALARGKLVTVFDVEDRPEPLQLRRAVAAFRRLGCGRAKVILCRPARRPGMLARCLGGVAGSLC